jgi:hypothetical protein
LFIQLLDLRRYSVERFDRRTQFCLRFVSLLLRELCLELQGVKLLDCCCRLHQFALGSFTASLSELRPGISRCND